MSIEETINTFNISSLVNYAFMHISLTLRGCRGARLRSNVKQLSSCMLKFDVKSELAGMLLYVEVWTAAKASTVEFYKATKRSVVERRLTCMLYSVVRYSKRAKT